MMHGTAARTAIIGQLALVVAGCTQMGNSVPASNSTSSTSGMTAEQTAGGWRSLLDPSLAQWRGYKQQTVPTGWSFANGVLTKTGSAEDPRAAW